MQYSNKIKVLEQTSTTTSLLLYLKTYAAIFLAMYLGLGFNYPLWSLLVIIFIAGRQHTLYILNHDASHYALFANKALNKLVATLFSNLVMFHHPEAWSFIQWRHVHLKHHSHLFTPDDQIMRVELEEILNIELYSMNRLLWKCLLAIPQTIKFIRIGQQDLVSIKGNHYTRACINHLQALFKPYSD